MATKTRRAKLLKRKVSRDIKRINPDEAAAILEEVKKEAEQKAIEATEEHSPGETFQGTKVSYSYADCERMFPYVTFTPEETVPLTWNGVKVQAIANYEMHVPKCFYDIYVNHRKVKMQHAATLKEAGLDDLGVLPLGGLLQE